MISLSNFSSLFELFAGINLAFIAVNYLNDYTNILANKIFQIETFIEDNFKELLDRIKELNQQLQGVNYKEEKYVLQASKLARKGETHIASLEKKSDDTGNDAIERCCFKTFSSTCLWSFLFCCFVLFISGYESVDRTYINILNIQETIIVFSVFSLIFFIFCWIFSGTEIKLLGNFIHRLSYVLSLCVSFFIISIIISLNIELEDISNKYSVYLILLPILIPCVNFIFSICPTFYRVNSIKSETRKFINSFKDKEIKEFEEDVTAILKLKEWNLDIEEKREITFEIRGIRHSGHQGLKRIESLIINEELILILEPDNPYDSNAIVITTKDGTKIGYVPKELTSELKNIGGNLKPYKCLIFSIHHSSDIGNKIKVITTFT